MLHLYHIRVSIFHLRYHCGIKAKNGQTVKNIEVSFSPSIHQGKKKSGITRLQEKIISLSP